MNECDYILKECKPDLVLVHGDTSTTLCGAQAAFYQQIPIGHVESGLRTYSLYSPWPEEANRQLTSVITKLHFSPTKAAAQNLFEWADAHSYTAEAEWQAEWTQ